MIKRFTTGIGVGALLLTIVLPAWAHGGGEEGVAVELADVTAGNTVVFTGEGLEEDSDRIIVLVGGDLTVQLGSVTTTADGTFETEVTIPDYVPSGQYELQAVGDETLFANVNVTAAAGGAATSGSAGAETLSPRSHSAGELAIWGIVVLLSAAIGGWLVWRAERLAGGHPSAAE